MNSGTFSPAVDIGGYAPNLPTVSLNARRQVTTMIVLSVFLLFFQGFMVAPLLPRLAVVFGTTVDRASALVPAYTVPYGCICLVIGPVADRVGRARMLRWLVAIGVLMPLLTATASSLAHLLFWRVIAGIELGGIAPIGLAMIAQLYPYEERGRPVGWVFGAIAGGMAFGATCGPWLEPFLGWRGLFLLVAALDLALAIPMWRVLRSMPLPATVLPTLGPAGLVRAYLALLGSRKGGTLYGYVFCNGLFHSGVFSWLGVYFTQRYHLQSGELGLAMMGYGVPGFLLGPVVGRLADRWGRRGLIRGGLLLAACCALTLTAPLPVLGATAVTTALSAGFDLSHPLFSGMISSLDPVRTAQAMALNTFGVFVGFGLGSMLFGALYAAMGMTFALTAFGSFQLVLAALSWRLLHPSWR